MVVPTSESKTRGKPNASVVVRVQMLSELEEVISYKDHMEEPERQLTQRNTWSTR